LKETSEIKLGFPTPCENYLFRYIILLKKKERKKEKKKERKKERKKKKKRKRKKEKLTCPFPSWPN